MAVSNSGMCFQVLHALGSQSIEIWFSKVAQNFTAVCLLNEVHLRSPGCLAYFHLYGFLSVCSFPFLLWDLESFKF